MYWRRLFLYYYDEISKCSHWLDNVYVYNSRIILIMKYKYDYYSYQMYLSTS